MPSSSAINPIYPIVATTYPDIGIHFHDDEADWQLVDVLAERTCL